MLPALLNTSLLLLVSGIHVYWSFGGTWGLAVALPERPDRAGQKAFQPGRGLTLLVAAGLAVMAALHLYRLDWLPGTLPGWLTQYGLLGVGGIFFLRAVGDFRYVGFFKTTTETAFARLDTAFYIPLCLVISICAFWTALSPLPPSFSP